MVVIGSVFFKSPFHDGLPTDHTFWLWGHEIDLSIVNSRDHFLPFLHYLQFQMNKSLFFSLLSFT